jgi:broad specificity phosphatase PhoE
MLLARHGETDWNRQQRWQGQANVPLNGDGRAQAQALSATLKKEPLAAVYSSTLQRAVETAHLIAVQHRINVSRDARLNEINLGAWEGLSRKEILARYPDLLAAWEADPRSVTPPKGESFAQLEERVLAVMHEIAHAYPGETVCLIGHKMTLGAIRCRYLGLELKEALGSDTGHGRLETVEIPYPFM